MIAQRFRGRNASVPSFLTETGHRQHSGTGRSPVCAIARALGTIASACRAAVTIGIRHGGHGAEEIVREALPELQPERFLIAPALAGIGRESPWRYGEHYFPHDVKLREWGAAGRSRALTLMGLGVKPIRVGALRGPAERINATRALLPLMRFNRTRRVMLGLSRLRRYARRQSTTLGGFAGPLHDINSHGADAFGEYAVNCPLIALKAVAVRPRPPSRSGVFLEGPPVERLGRRLMTPRASGT